MKQQTKKKTVTKTIKSTKKELELSIPVYDLSGKIEKQLNLPKDIFSVKVNPRLLAQYVRVYLTNQRQGTASTKTRGQVTGSTRKIYRQKGTGRARHGDIKAPIFVGGGIVGGPQPKTYHLKINKKQRRKAFYGALTYQFQNGNLLGLDDGFLTIEPKTKKFIDFLKKTNLEKEKKLIIIPKEGAKNLILAARNIPQLVLASSQSINSYLILNCQKILIVDKAVEEIKNINQKDEN